MINSFYNINLTTDVTLPVVNVHVIYYGVFNCGQKALTEAFISGISSSYLSIVSIYYTNYCNSTLKY